jgi:CRISPR-associated protein Cas5d
MYHGITYADEAYSEDTKGHMTVNFWYPVMRNGIITFPTPEKCPIHKTLREMEIKPFGQINNNFAGLKEFGEVT